MKTRFFITLIALASLTISCKDEKSVDAVKTEELNKNFKVILNAVVNENDSFQLYYTEEAFGVPGHSAPYQEENSVWVDVKGNTSAQDIVFTLPEDVIPNYIRMDFGTNSNQKEITINNFTMSYMDKKFEAKGSLYFNYFVPNQSIKVENGVTGVIKPTKMSNGAYDPLFYSDLPLYNEIQKIIK